MSDSFNRAWIDLWDEVQVRCATTEGDRLRRLVIEVYAKLPKRIREKTIEKINYWLLADAAFSDRSFNSTFVVIPGDFLKRSDRWLRTTITHEIAHVLLAKDGETSNNGGYEGEKAADDLCEKWGFGRSYSEKRLRMFPKVSQKQ